MYGVIAVLQKRGYTVTLLHRLLCGYLALFISVVAALITKIYMPGKNLVHYVQEL